MTLKAALATGRTSHPQLLSASIIVIAFYIERRPRAFLIYNRLSDGQRHQTNQLVTHCRILFHPMAVRRDRS